MVESLVVTLQDMTPLEEQERLARRVFEVVPHSSGYVEGIDPNKLKEILCDLDDDRFREKNAQ